MKTNIEMAKEAGLVGGPVYARGLEAFAALVRADEREECALIAENHPAYDWHKAPCEITYAIRARGNT